MSVVFFIRAGRNSCSFFFNTFMGLASENSIDQQLWVLYLLPVVWLLCFSVLHLYRQLNTLTFCAFLIFGVLLIVLGYFEIFILLIILTWALKRKIILCME